MACLKSSIDEDCNDCCNVQDGCRRKRVMNEPLDGLFKESHTPAVVVTNRIINIEGIEAPSVNQPDQGLPLRELGPASVCWLGVERAALPSLAVSAVELVHDRACRLLFCLVLA